LPLAAALAACGGAEGADNARPAPLVAVESVRPMRFVDRVEAVGTANANEQVTLSAPVTERLIRINFDAGQQLSRISELRRRGFATRANQDTQVAAAATARAEAAEARASIGDRVITAPFSGWVSLRTISPGAIVAAGTEIATVSDISRIKLDFSVPETLLPVLRPGLPIEAVSAAWGNEPFRGQIANIDPVVDPNTRAVKVRATLPNPDRRLRPGMLLTVNIDTEPRTALSVPELAVVGEGDRRFVYVLGDKGEVKRTQIRTGIRSGGMIEVLQGLRPGQRVVSEGVVKLSDGMKVRVAGAGNVAPAAGRD
jgi:membrane fusion protein (multidrug efflux system)